MTIKKLTIYFQKGKGDSKEIKPFVFKKGKVTLRKLYLLFSKGEGDSKEIKPSIFKRGK